MNDNSSENNNSNDSNDSSENDSNDSNSVLPAKSKRGFASMDPAKQREIASKGGLMAHLKGLAHQFTSDEAREAGKKGGARVSQNKQHMAEIGRIGGLARGKQRVSLAK
jgi:uncharacterized protein